MSTTLQLILGAVVGTALNTVGFYAVFFEAGLWWYAGLSVLILQGLAGFVSGAMLAHYAKAESKLVVHLRPLSNV